MQWLPFAASIQNVSATSARFGHSAVCISGSGSVWGTDLVVMFGGVTYSDHVETALDHHAALANVTVFQAEADMWFDPQVSPASADSGLPEPRAFHCAVAVDRRMYMFGGHVMSYDHVLNKKRRRFFNDLWCLDTDTWTWQCLGSGAGVEAGLVGLGGAVEVPPRRDMATLTRAGSSCLLLFGGRLESGKVAGDAWVLNLNTHTWSQLKLPGPSPPPRKMHAAVFMTNRVVIFGGERDTGLLDDLWTLKGVDGSEAARWTQIKLRPAPSGRFGHAMAACGSRLAVFGGCLDHSALLSFSRTYVQCNELWVLDMATFSWHRVEAPEGVMQVTGQALEDPNLLLLLQQQAQQPEEEAMERPKGHQLLPLPLERMCHSLVLVGPEALERMLLLGGRKRDGICEDAWWLTLGPDNLTPVLAVPPPETLATALLAVSVQRAAQVRSQPPNTATAITSTSETVLSPAHPGTLPAPTTAPPTASPSPSTSTSTSAPALPNPSLLSHLFGKTPTSAAGHQHQQYLQKSVAVQPAGGGSGSAAPRAGPLHSSSVSALETVLPVTSSATGGASQRMMASKSAGSITLDPNVAPAAAQAALSPNSFMTGHQPQPQPQLQPGHSGSIAAGGGGNGSSGNGGPTAGRDRVAGAINRLTKHVVTTLLRNDSAPATAQAAIQVPQSASGGLIARLLEPAAARGVATATSAMSTSASTSPSSAATASRVAHCPAALNPVGASGRAAEDESTPGSPFALASSLPPDVCGPLDQLRASLGLPTLGGSQSSSGPTSPNQTDPGTALLALGRRLADEGAEAPTTSGGGMAAAPGVGSNDMGAIALARHHLASCAPEQLTIGQLCVVLEDCKALLKARTASGWKDMECAVRQDAKASHGGTFTLATLDRTTLLTCLVAYNSHWLTGLLSGDVRLEDIPRVMSSYGELVREVAGKQELVVTGS